MAIGNAQYRAFQILQRPDVNHPGFQKRLKELERVLGVKGYTLTKDIRGVIATPHPDNENDQELVINHDTILNVMGLVGV